MNDPRTQSPKRGQAMTVALTKAAAFLLTLACFAISLAAGACIISWSLS